MTMSLWRAPSSVTRVRRKILDETAVEGKVALVGPYRRDGAPQTWALGVVADRAIAVRKWELQL